MRHWHRLWVAPPSAGAGVAVGLIDGGLARHRSMPAVAGADFRHFAGTQGDPTGHGTAAIGLVASIVPEARFIVAQALRDDFTASDSDLADALSWVLDRGARVVLLGIGRARVWGTPPDAAWEARAAAASQRGALLLAPCGNGSRPGRPEAVRDPAACPSVVAVGATDRLGVPMVANAASDGVAAIDVYAPGVGVYAPAAGDREVEISGSSAAAAVATGWAAAIAGARVGAEGSWIRNELIVRSALRRQVGLLDPRGSTS